MCGWHKPVPSQWSILNNSLACAQLMCVQEESITAINWRASKMKWAKIRFIIEFSVVIVSSIFFFVQFCAFVCRLRRIAYRTFYNVSIDMLNKKKIIPIKMYARPIRSMSFMRIKSFAWNQFALSWGAKMSVQMFSWALLFSDQTPYSFCSFNKFKIFVSFATSVNQWMTEWMNECMHVCMKEGKKKSPLKRSLWLRNWCSMSSLIRIFAENIWMN